MTWVLVLHSDDIVDIVVDTVIQKIEQDCYLTKYLQMETNGTPTSPGGEVPSDTTDKYTR